MNAFNTTTGMWEMLCTHRVTMHTSLDNADWSCNWIFLLLYQCQQSVKSYVCDCDSHSQVL